MTTRQELSDILRSKGFRITPQREQILDIFLDLPEGNHLSAEDLQRNLNATDSDISLATSYRTLKLLASLGVLRELDFNEDYKHYELCRDASEIQHQHIICTDCAQTVEFTSIELHEMAKTIAEQHGFEMINMQFKIYARCQSHNTPAT
jgi:Fur family transcriptional regulator, ferric uptake regulator